MANEITVSLSLNVTKSNLQISRSASGVRADMSGSLGDTITQTIGTTDEALEVQSDLGTKGWAYFRNLDATNYVEIGVRDGGATFIPFAKLKPGEPGVIRLSSSTIYAKANTAAVKLEHTILAD